MANPDVVVLYRPVGPAERDLIAASGWRRFPPRLPEQPIFYPVCHEAYARQIAARWNVPASGAGFVLRFAIRAEFLTHHPIHRVGGPEHEEYWIPAAELEAFNEAIVGPIEQIAAFPA